MNNTTTFENGELVIVRYFDAHREALWRAWSEPDMVKKWWGPKNFTAPSVTIDFTVGGKYLFCMRGKPSPDAPESDFYSTGTYEEIVPMDRIVCTDSFADKDGTIVPSTFYGMEGFPDACKVIIEFEGSDGTTKMTLHHYGLPTGELADMTGAGWNQSFDKLTDALAA